MDVFNRAVAPSVQRDRVGNDANAVVCCCLHVPFQPVCRPLTVEFGCHQLRLKSTQFQQIAFGIKTVHQTFPLVCIIDLGSRHLLNLTQQLNAGAPEGRNQRIEVGDTKGYVPQALGTRISRRPIGTQRLCLL